MELKNRNYEFPIVAVNQNDFEEVHKWGLKNKQFVAKKKLYIYGAGIRGNMILRVLEKSGIEVAGFIDGSEEKQGASVGRLRIFSLEELINDRELYILVSPENDKAIIDMLEENGYRRYQKYDKIESTNYENYVKEFVREGDIRYLFFGDCFFPDLDINELDQKTMGDMVRERLGEIQTKVLTMHGMCTPSFYHILRRQLCMGIKPDVVAFIVNVPFCTGIQTKLPESQHPELFRRLEMLGTDDEFSRYVELTRSRADNINQKAFSTKQTDSNQKENVEKMLTKMRYMYKFDEKNENIVYAKKIIELLKENGISPKPFIPALHYEMGEMYWGEDFFSCYNKICSEIHRVMEGQGVEVLDMSYLLQGDMFYGEYMTKFPNSKGKEKEVNALIDFVTGGKEVC